MDAYFGVDFYGNGEVVNLGELKKCEIVFDDYDNWKSYTDINKVIELYNVKKYIDTGIRLEDWTNPQYTDYQIRLIKCLELLAASLIQKI